MTRPRFFVASIASTLATVTIPIIVGLMIRPSTLPDGTLDDAPYRASRILIILLLLASPFLAVAWYFFTRTLTRFKKLSKSWLLLSSLLMSCIICVCCAVPQYINYGPYDSFVFLFVSLALTLPSLVAGVLVWWFAAFMGRDKQGTG